MNSSGNKYGLFTEQGCLTVESIMQYMSGKLSEYDGRLVQQHISGCDLCKEAVQGAGNFSDPDQYQKGIDLLKDRWSRRNIQERKISTASLAAIISVAASIVLIVSIHLATRYQKKIRAQYLASIYQQGTTIDNALNTSDVLHLTIKKDSQLESHRIEIAVREKYRQNTPKLKNENIPVALLDETRITAGSNEGVKEDRSATVMEKKSGILRYPYRIMSMPPPEKSTSGREKSSLEELFYIVEEMPQFQWKGIQMFCKYLQQNVRYPAAALEKHISGRVYVQFTIDERGRLVNGTILKSCHPILDKEVLRVINNSPLWQPGKQRGKPVKVSMVMPVDFVLY